MVVATAEKNCKKLNGALLKKPSSHCPTRRLTPKFSCGRIS
jgi:hypothetical protein